MKTVIEIIDGNTDEPNWVAKVDHDGEYPTHEDIERDLAFVLPNIVANMDYGEEITIKLIKISDENWKESVRAGDEQEQP